MSGFVYLWENKINGMKYVGSHVGSVEDSYIGSGIYFNRAIKTHGIENFERSILEFVEENANIKIREQYWLDHFDAAHNEKFYNLNPRAGGGWEYVNNNLEIRKKVKEKNKNLWSKKQHPRGMLGKQHKKESWEKTRSAWKMWADENLKRPVLQFDLDMNLTREHESITAAAKFVNGNPSNIKYTIEGKFSKAYGYKWKYKEKQ